MTIQSFLPGRGRAWRQLCALSAFLPCLVLGQPDFQSSHVVFQPMPIPSAGETPLPLVPLDAISFSAEDVTEGLSPLSLGEVRRLEQAIADYELAIGDKESVDGPYSRQLEQDLFGAAVAARELRDYEQALDYLERAQYVVRINNGLDTLEQIPVMKAMVGNYQSLGQLRQADDVQQAILNLVREAYGQDSPQTIPAMLDYGDWHMDAFLDRSNILINVDRMNAVQFINDPMNFIHNPKPLRETPLYNLYLSQQSFLHAIELLLQQQDYNNPLLMDLEKMLLKSYLLSIHRENILYEPDFYLTRKKSKTGSRLNTNSIELMESEEYRLGIESHDRSLAYLVNNPARTPSQLATTMLEAADWHLLFERKVRAAREYEKVYDFFNDNPAMAEAAADVLYPGFPVVLPVYLPPPNSREKFGIGDDDPVNFFGYVDVSFNIDKFGKTRKVRVLGQGGEVSRNLEIRLARYLQKNLFRPLYRDGKPYTGNLRLRYYMGI